MGWKRWSAVAVVIGSGILLQIPGHDEAEISHAEAGHSEMPAAVADTEGTLRTVALDVTGMT